jgi:hypothetical protein
VWKTPIRTATLRENPREQGTDLIALFDLAYSLSRQYPDKNILAYAIGRLADVHIRHENAELFQRLSTQCLLAEPGTSAVVLERLAMHRARGLPVNYIELAEVLNDQIVEHAPLGHANEVAWALWGTLIFNLSITKAAAKVLSDVEDDAVALLALHSRERGLMHVSLSTALWQSYLTADQLFGEHWLLAYEAPIKGWLPSASGADHVGAEASFDWLRNIGVQFYETEKAAAIPAPTAGVEGPEWLADLEEQLNARRSWYGETDLDVESVDFAELGLDF